MDAECLFLHFVTFHVSHRWCEMYSGHPRLCVCLSVCLSATACLHYCTNPGVTRGSGRRCLLVVHCWVDLQSVHGLRCCGNIVRTLVNQLASILRYDSISQSTINHWFIWTADKPQPLSTVHNIQRKIMCKIVWTRNVSECSVLTLCLVCNIDCGVLCSI